MRAFQTNSASLYIAVVIASALILLRGFQARVRNSFSTETAQTAHILPVSHCLQGEGRLQSVLHGVRRHDHATPLLQQLHWLSVPERVNFKQTLRPCISLSSLPRPWILLRVWEVKTQRISGSCPRFILDRDCVRPPVGLPTSWFLPHVGLHSATTYFRSQEFGHGTRYRPVSPPRRPSVHSGDFWKLFCSRDNCINKVVSIMTMTFC